MICKKCGWNNVVDGKFCTNCGARINIWQKNLRLYIILLIVICIIVLLVIYSWQANKAQQATEQLTLDKLKQQDILQNEKLARSNTQKNIVSSVVNVFCREAGKYDGVSGGSGTILTDNGLIITNSHVIPQVDNNLNTTKEGCLITIADENTGAPKEIYYANPIVLSSLSDTYDLAFLKIYDVYTDNNGNTYGEYPKKFINYKQPEDCTTENISLGDKIRIFGYPITSGSYNLVLTEGVVSSFTEDGLVMTSAKIDHGNSGGLAVDDRGCMIGIPSAVSKGQLENLGIIIPTNKISDFLDQAIKLSNQSNN